MSRKGPRERHGQPQSSPAWQPRGGLTAEPEDRPNPARPSQIVAGLFDVKVAAAELRERAVTAALLYPAEAACCTGFALKRLHDFTAGRLCARRALAELGVYGFPLTVNADRTPRWPPGIVGSISHTDGFGCAVVAAAADVGSIGVDVELVGRVGADIAPLVFTAAESASLATLTIDEYQRAATMIFSAKEAFYKCQYAVTGRWLDFGDASLAFTSAALQSGTFTVEAAYGTLGLGDDARVPLRGRYAIDGDVVVTGIALLSCSPSIDVGADDSGKDGTGFFTQRAIDERRRET